MITPTIAFDGDDTLWHNEVLFQGTQDRFRALLAAHADPAHIDRRLLEVEQTNLRLFGYGIKGFTLSMIETAIELTDGRITGREIETLIGWGKTMLEHPAEPIDGVRETLEILRGTGRWRLIVITKGDLFDQETKVARSGLAELFDAVEIVSEKDVPTYRAVCARQEIDADALLMVGNSLRSDILPVLDLGGRAAHVPYHVTWAHELVAPPKDPPPGFHQLQSIREVPALASHLFG